jgi:alkylation response protein AidB-like acyl-CoA dehydrogenase
MTLETKKYEALKGGEFLIKDSDPQSVFIPEDISEEQKLMADSAREFVEKEILPKLNEIDHQESGLTVSLLEKAGELGLLGTAVPEQYGGLGENFNTNTFISMEMGASHSFGVSFAAHTGIGTLPILYYGTEEQKKKISS